MKQKWLELTWPQRVVIFIQAFLILLFLILYCTLGRQQVITHDGEYLRRRASGEVTTYSGKIDGQKPCSPSPPARWWSTPGAAPNTALTPSCSTRPPSPMRKTPFSTRPASDLWWVWRCGRMRRCCSGRISAGQPCVSPVRRERRELYPRP